MTALENLSPTLNPGSLCQNGDHTFFLKSSNLFKQQGKFNFNQVKHCFVLGTGKEM